MVQGRRGRRGAAAVVPVAVLSAAWTLSVVGVDASPSASSSPVVPVSPSAPSTAPVSSPFPDTSALTEAPATVAPTTAATTPGRVLSAVAHASPSDIPTAALLAYQRAETVIDAADPSCHLTWQLLAAVGRAESDHGRIHGSALAADGVARPAIYGPRLDGSAHTARVADTDGGALDHDTREDRAVGPMQFLPATWASVGVDADDDGVRDPQDIDDAALGAAVYLCSGSDDLATDTGRRAALLRYNHSSAYVGDVLAVMRGYLHGGVALQGVPTTVDAGLLTPPDADDDSAPHEARTAPAASTARLTQHPSTHAQRVPPRAPHLRGHHVTSGTRPTPGAPTVTCPGVPEPTDEPTDEPTGAATDAPPADPTTDPTDSPTDPTADPTDSPTDPPTDPSTGDPTDPCAVVTTVPTAVPTAVPTTTPTGTPAPRPSATTQPAATER